MATGALIVSGVSSNIAGDQIGESYARNNGMHGAPAIPPVQALNLGEGIKRAGSARRSCADCFSQRALPVDLCMRFGQGRYTAHLEHSSPIPTHSPENLTSPVTGHDCGVPASCGIAIAIQAGVESAHVDLMSNRATVVFDPLRPTPALCGKRFAEQYDAVLRARAIRDGAAIRSTPAANRTSRRGLTIIAGVVAMVLAMLLVAHGPVDPA